MKPRVVLIIQARMGSTRLPGKVLMPILGEPMLARQLERLRRCQLVDQMIVATTENPNDDAIAGFVALQPDTGLYRGSESDVLKRYAQAARAAKADVVVRVTSDCPLIEPRVVDECVSTFLAHGEDVDYVSNTQIRTYPRGFDTEVLSIRALSLADSDASVPYEREHVTPYIWEKPDRFRLVNVAGMGDYSDLRLTVDTPEDFELVRNIYEILYPDNPEFTYGDILNLLEHRPDLRALNAQVKQKTFSP